MTVAELREALAPYPDETLILASLGVEILDVHGIETATEILAWFVTQSVPPDVLRRARACHDEDYVYVSLAHFG